jgi:hypothetical protein
MCENTITSIPAVMPHAGLQFGGELGAPNWKHCWSPLTSLLRFMTKKSRRFLRNRFCGSWDGNHRKGSGFPGRETSRFDAQPGYAGFSFSEPLAHGSVGCPGFVASSEQSDITLPIGLTISVPGNLSITNSYRLRGVLNLRGLWTDLRDTLLMLNGVVPGARRDLDDMLYADDLRLNRACFRFFMTMLTGNSPKLSF